MTNPGTLINEILATYQRHGWQLRRMLLQAETRAALYHEPDPSTGIVSKEAGFDALWFSRPSQQQREAWELRLVTETPYALFQTFEADETEDQREAVRLEMEARMREYVRK
jgi:hypothetical protein